jgi:hypothetical protein
MCRQGLSSLVALETRSRAQFVNHGSSVFIASSPRSEGLTHEIEVVGTRTRRSVHRLNGISDKSRNGLARPCGLRIKCLAFLSCKGNLGSLHDVSIHHMTQRTAVCRAGSTDPEPRTANRRHRAVSVKDTSRLIVELPTRRHPEELHPASLEPQGVLAKSTSLVSTVPAVRPGAVW